MLKVSPATTSSTCCFAHSLTGRPCGEWEPLAKHAVAVGDLASEFAKVFGWDGMACAAGRLHDAGKASAEFQAYIQGNGGSVDHSTKGARVANTLYQGLPGRILALCIAGHHAGLADAEDLDRRLDPRHSIPEAPEWTKHIVAPLKADLNPSQTFSSSNPDGVAFTQAFLVRMLFSCLVDADFLATEAFMSGETVERGIRIRLETLRNSLSVHMESLRRDVKPTELNGLRAKVLDHAVAKAPERPGFFTLTVPTGGGKTLASLSFSLNHAIAHGKRRVIYVIPFTSIIEQTADVFRDALGPDPVLEHHSNLDWDAAARAFGRDGGDERDGLGVLRRAAENWDAPIVVTTAVQFFESLFANRTSACRKLHNIADSVIVLDEAQTLPQRFLLPCLAALDELQRNYGVSVVLCTATQPALRRQDGALKDARGRTFGLDIPETRELAPHPIVLYQALKRVAVEVLPGATTDATVAARFAEASQMLCIVNSRAHARGLFDRIAGLPGAAHLTTLMCPAHRRQVLAGLRTDLKAGKPVRLVATSLIEAGVDISFPEVWRAMAGVDSIAQAAGRCNREGELLPKLGRVVVFTPAEGRTPAAFRLPRQAAHGVLRDFSADPLSLEAVGAFFRQLWFQKGIETLDGARIGDRLGYGVLAALRETVEGCRFPFESIANAFHLIDEVMRPVVVPWKGDAHCDGEATLQTVAAATVLPRDALRRLQQFTVGIPSEARDVWLAAGVIVPVRRELGDTLLRFADLAHYRSATGVDLADTMRREAEDNVW